MPKTNDTATSSFAFVGEHVYAFLLGIHLGIKFPCLSSTSVDNIKYFSQGVVTVFTPLLPPTLPLLLSVSLKCSHSGCVLALYCGWKLYSLSFHSGWKLYYIYCALGDFPMAFSLSLSFFLLIVRSFLYTLDWPSC